MKKIKFITAIYSNLWGTELGGRPSRQNHYRWSLLSLLKMSNADFVCFTSEEEYSDLSNFFYKENNIDTKKLILKVFNLQENKYKDLIKKYKNIELTKKGDRCVEIQYMKFAWTYSEINSGSLYDYYFWIDAGLSHCGLVPSRYLSLTGPNNRGYYESSIFNNKLLDNLVLNTENKFTMIGKENQRNYWSGTVNPKHFSKYNNSIHIIGGLFGGKREIWLKVIPLFESYLTKVTESDGRLYHEEDVMTLLYRNHEELCYRYHFDTWWHEEEKITGIDINEHLKINKSFYKILEELNE